MSSIRFLCPECGARLSVESGDAQLFIPCPHCQKHIRAWGSRLLDIKFSCPDCRKKMVIDASAAGCSVNCPGCAKAVIVPSGEPSVNTPLPVPANPAPLVTSTPIARSTSPSALLSEEEIAFLAGTPD